MKHIFLAMMFSAAAITAAQAGPQATEMGAGMLYAGPAQARVVCYFFNMGPHSHRIQEPVIANFTNAITLDVVGCNGVVLEPGQSCGFAGPATNNEAYSCAAALFGDTKEIRGILALRDGNETNLRNIEVR